MEDAYTIKVKTKPDVRNLYPSERRYSASTVAGFAWVHISMSIILIILTCLAPIPVENSEFPTERNITDNSYLLLMAPSLVSIFAMTAGVAAILSSVKWYIDKNINLFFIACIVCFISCISAVCLIITWSLTKAENVIVLQHTDVLDRNETHFVININATEQRTFTNVVPVNITIAILLEMISSILSIKIAYKGMKSTYNEEKRGKCVQVTKLKGKQPNRVFLAHNKNGFYLKNEKAKDTSSDLYKDRMMDFLNESFDGVSNTEKISERAVSVTPSKRITPLSWGDTPDHTIYNQNTLNLEQIFNDKTDITKM